MVENIDLLDGPYLTVTALPGAAALITIFLDANITALDNGGTFHASEPHVLFIDRIDNPNGKCTEVRFNLCRSC